MICPVFEEAASILDFHHALRAQLDQLAPVYSGSVLYVCDPGRDNTQAKLRQIAAEDKQARVICLSRRFGHQASILAGMDHVDADVVAMMDCDMQHPPDIIPRLLAEHERGFDIVHVVRAYGSAVGWFKRSSSWFYYRLLQWLADTPIRHDAADFRLISRRVCHLFQTSIRERNQFLRGLFSWVGFAQTEITFEALPRARGATKYTFWQLMRFAITGIISFSKKPLRYAAYAGLLTGVFGLVVAAVTVVQYLSGMRFPAGWATLVALVAIIGGAQLVFLGVLGEYVGSIVDDVKGRPLYIVDFTLNFDA